MASVTINQGMPAPEESALEVSRDRWQLLAMARRQWAEIELPFDCRLLKLVQDEAPILAEAMGYESGEQFLTDYLSLDMDLVRRVVGWLEREEPAEAVPLAVAAAAAQAQPLAEHGTNQHRGDEAGVADRHSTPTNQLSSESQERILRRLARDAPEVLERVKAGEFRSARAAAIEAGIIRDIPIVRLTDPERVAAKLREHWDDEQITALCEALLR